MSSKILTVILCELIVMLLIACLLAKVCLSYAENSMFKYKLKQQLVDINTGQKYEIEGCVVVDSTRQYLLKHDQTILLASEKQIDEILTKGKQ